jgi:hypothetical protein
VLPLPKAFLWQPLTVQTRQTRQAVFAISLYFLDVYGKSTIWLLVMKVRSFEKGKQKIVQKTIE